ncbi:hypothetical protein ACU4HD_19465 [Cupriavidus basilensis]
MNASIQPLKAGTNVKHERHGIGLVMLIEHDTAVVRFAHGIEQVLAAELLALTSLADAISNKDIAPSLEVAPAGASSRYPVG